jgi:rubrerythrin
MKSKEKETAAMFSEAAESINDPQIIKLFNDLEQCARSHHGRIFDSLERDTNKKIDHWLKNLLWLEMENHNLYNCLMAQITDPSSRQMFRELRDSKMRSITLLQKELSQH